MSLEGRGMPGTGARHSRYRCRRAQKCGRRGSRAGGDNRGLPGYAVGGDRWVTMPERSGPGAAGESRRPADPAGRRKRRERRISRGQCFGALGPVCGAGGGDDKPSSSFTPIPPKRVGYARRFTVVVGLSGHCLGGAMRCPGSGTRIGQRGKPGECSRRFAEVRATTRWRKIGKQQNYLKNTGLHCASYRD